LSSSHDDMFREMFFEEAHELLSRLQTGLAGLAEASGDRAAVDRVYRDAHSLKGAAAMVGYPMLADSARSMEQVLAQVRTGKAPWTAELAASLASDRDRLAESIEVEERQLRERSQ
jgi:two-component system, chemotaxis family, sensor kinase CheA